MKVLNPTVTVMLASHLKANWLPSTLESILGQTRLDLEVVVCDSGEWIGRERDYDAPDHPAAMDVTRYRYSGHPLVNWVTLGEPPNLRGRACPYAHVWNRIIDAGLVRGRYVAVFTDDDLYHPEFIARMAGHLDAHPEARAVWCSQDRVRVDGAGDVTAGSLVIRADHVKAAGWVDNVDMTQVMFTRTVFDWMPPPWFDETAADESCRHADGLFLERMAEFTGPVPNIPEVLVTHRYTPVSTYN